MKPGRTLTHGHGALIDGEGHRLITAHRPNQLGNPARAGYRGNGCSGISGDGKRAMESLLKSRSDLLRMHKARVGGLWMVAGVGVKPTSASL